MIFTQVFQKLFRALTITALLVCGACRPAPEGAPTRLPAVSLTTPTITEQPVRLLPLTGPLDSPQAELSGLAWFGDTLILLPQYPDHYIQSDAPESFGALFTISKSDILACLSGKTTSAFNPRPVPLYAPGLANKISGYEGFESIVFDGNRVFLTIETHRGADMLALLVGGEMAPDLSKVTLNPAHLEEIPAQASISNFSDEALMLVDHHLFTFYEGNGVRVTPHPVSHGFDEELNPLGVIPSPSLEYRITDATPAGSDGRFWVINYFYPGDTKIAPTSDPLFERYGIPASHRQSPAVERLVQLQWNVIGISLVERPPLYLQLLADGSARNWEGLAQLDDLGFLLVTDSHPGTLLGFVAYQ